MSTTVASNMLIGRMNNMNDLTLFAFSDWRVQSFSKLERFLKSLEKKPDVIVYGGDDTERFIESNIDNDSIIQFTLPYSKSKNKIINDLCNHLYSLHINSYKLKNHIWIKNLEALIEKTISSDYSDVNLNEIILSDNRIENIPEEFEEIDIHVKTDDLNINSGIYISIKTEKAWIEKYVPIADSRKPPSTLVVDSISREPLVKIFQIFSDLNTFNENVKIDLNDLSLDYIYHDQVIGTERMRITKKRIKELIKEYVYFVFDGSVTVNVLIPNYRMIRRKNRNHENYDAIVENTIQQLVNIEKKSQMKNWFEILANYSKYGLVAVIGNDCMPYYSSFIKGKNVYYIGKEDFNIGNYQFMGVDGSEKGEHGIGSTLLTPDEITGRLKNANINSNSSKIIVSHTPPHGILDIGIRHGINRIGSVALREFIDEDESVGLVICGHVHSQGGNNMNVNHYEVVNAASHDHDGAKGIFSIIRMNNGKVSNVEWYDTRTELEKIQGIGPIKLEKLEKAGIYRINQLLETSIDDLMIQTNFSKRSLNNFMKKIRAQQTQGGLWTGKLKFPPIDECIYFDIETDLDFENKQIWLIGWYYKGKIYQEIANNLEDEIRIIESFNSFLKNNPGQPLVAYSGTYFDFNYLIKAADRLEIIDFKENICNRTWFDLLINLRKVYSTGKSMGLKSMGDYFKYKFKQKGYDGLRLAQEYLIDLRTNSKISGKFRKIALEYNEDDVRLILHILDNIRDNLEIYDEFVGTPKKSDIVNDKIAKTSIKENSISITCDTKYSEKIYFEIMRLGIPHPNIPDRKNVFNMRWTSKLAIQILGKKLNSEIL